MRRNDDKFPITESQTRLSPFNHKKRKRNIFGKDFESNKIALSTKKSKEELFLPKKKISSNTYHHRRTKSSGQDFIEFMTKNNNIINNNPSASKLSYIFTRKENNKNYGICSVSRNRKFKYNLDEKRKSNSNSKLLSMSFSLKDFRNHLINSFSNIKLKELKNNNKYRNNENLKNNKSLYNFDNLTNIEETRNTTSITGFNNSNLIYSKRLSNKEKQSAKSTKYIITKNKQNKKLYSSKNNSSKNITSTNSNVIKEKTFHKYNLHRYIYKHYKIRPKHSLSKINNNSYLALTKKTFRNSQKCFSNLHNGTKLYIKPNNESENNSKSNNFYLKNNFNDDPDDISTVRNEKKNVWISNNNSKNKIIKKEKETYPKYKKRTTKSQENMYNIEISENVDNFKSVEEIHFIFVQISQRKKEFFKKKNIENIKDN
jgi:hypothetical protein